MLSVVVVFLQIHTRINNKPFTMQLHRKQIHLKRTFVPNTIHMTDRAVASDAKFFHFISTNTKEFIKIWKEKYIFAYYLNRAFQVVNKK